MMTLRPAHFIPVVLGGLAAIAAVPLASASPRKFNLDCDGTERSTEHGVALPPVDWRSSIRIDLDRRSYCYGGCERSYVIESADDGTITFSELEGPGNSQEHMEFDWRRGKLLWYLEFDLPNAGIHRSRLISATCVAAHYTGIP
jgi:hypothetical protein